MSKKKVELMLSDQNIEPTVSYGTITEIRDNYVIAKFSSDALQLIPIYRFIKENDKANLCVGTEVKVNRYYSNPTSKRLLAYNAELTTE